MSLLLKKLNENGINEIGIEPIICLKGIEIINNIYCSFYDINLKKTSDNYASIGSPNGLIKDNKLEEFITKWEDLAELCGEIFFPSKGTPVDDLFTRYMYYERAKQGNKSSTTEALRKFYEKNSYALLKNNQTFENLIDLASFWNDVLNQSVERFSDKVLRRLFVLNYAPNGMWTYFVSVYYMVNRNSDGLLDDDKFYTFLNRITAFVWAYAVTNPGVNALRTPVFAEI